MKRIIALILSLTMVFPLCACGKTSASEESSGTDPVMAELGIETLGDIFAMDHSMGGTASVCSDTEYVFCFFSGDTPYRAIAYMTPELNDKIHNIDIKEIDDYGKAMEEVVKDLPVSKLEDLSQFLLSKDDIEGLIGQPGKVMIDKGFWITSYVAGNDNQVFVSDEYFQYLVLMESNADTELDQDQALEYFSNTAIKEIKISGFGDEAVEI